MIELDRQIATLKTDSSRYPGNDGDDGLGVFASLAESALHAVSYLLMTSTRLNRKNLSVTWVLIGVDSE